MDMQRAGGLYQWKNACRLCLLEDGIRLPIFEDEGKQRQVSHKIQSCFPIVVYETDPLPKMICHKCLFKLETVFEFRLKCLDVNSALLKHLEHYSDDSDVQKYWATVKENFKSQDSCIKLQGTEGRNIKEHNISVPEETKFGVLQEVKCPRNTTRERKQVRKVSETHEHPQMVCSEKTIGARGARVTRSGNVSGDAASGIDAATVFQEVFLDEASSDGFLPEQQNGNDVLMLQDVPALDADSVAQKRKAGLASPPILTAEMIKKEPGTVEENPRVQFQTAQTTVAEPASIKLPVNSLPTIDSGSQNKGAATKLARAKCYVCKTCDFRSSSRLEMQEHLCALQTSRSCEVCSKAFYNKSSYNKHKRRNTCVGAFKRCPQCKADFKSLEALAKHQTIHFKVIACIKEEELHPCDCGKRFVCKLMLASHRKTHRVLKGKSLQACDKKLKYKCDVCGKSFLDSASCKSHKRGHNFSAKFRKGVGSNEVFSSQTRSTQSEKGNQYSVLFKCRYCARVIKSKGSYVNHLKIHSKPGSRGFGNVRNNSKSKLSVVMGGDKWLGRKCKQCNMVFDSRSAWLIHRREHMTASKLTKLTTLKGVENMNKDMPCNICNKAFTTNAELSAHLQVHSKNNIERPASRRPIIGIFQCSTCSKSFSSKDGKMRHQKNCPGHLGCFLCKVCNEKLETKEAYLAHLKTHGHLTCNTCCRMFKDEHALKIHICTSGGSIGSDGSLPFHKCPLCPKLFPSQNSRNSHMRAHKTHNNATDLGLTHSISSALQPLDDEPSSEKSILSKFENGYKCNICGKCTVTLNGGRQHIRLHSTLTRQNSKKNFKCPFCSRRFVSLNATYSHIAVNHPDASGH